MGQYLYIRNRPLKVEKGKRRFNLFTLGVDEGKTVIYNRLNKENESGAGVIHFNKKICDDSYFSQLTAEKRVIRYHKGFPRYEWHNVAKDKRNEAT